MRKTFIFIIVAVFLILTVIFLVLRGNEDDWIKDSKGVWIKHGNPSETPTAVLQQQEAVNCSLEKFNSFTETEEEINSQCLGICGDYVIDIVHVPRTAEDNLVENQCEEYRNGEVNHFIELDKKGILVRIV
jgi:hypothetical protein